MEARAVFKILPEQYVFLSMNAWIFFSVKQKKIHHLKIYEPWMKFFLLFAIKWNEIIIEIILLATILELDFFK